MGSDYVQAKPTTTRAKEIVKKYNISENPISSRSAGVRIFQSPTDQCMLYFQIEDNDPDGKASFFTEISKYNPEQREYQKVTSYRGEWKSNTKLAPGRYQVVVWYRESTPNQEKTFEFDIVDKFSQDIKHNFLR